MKVTKSLQKSTLLIKRTSETIEAKEQKSGFLLILLGTLAASILGNALKGQEVITPVEGVIRAGQSF